MRLPNKPKSKKKRLYSKIQGYLKRKQAVSRPLSVTFTKVNQIVRGWINYFRIGSMKNVNVNIKFTKSVSLTFTSSGCYDLHLQSWTSYPLFDMTFL